jgi:peptidoglycan hydrolase-like protein with peptidoglycan-binding domain
VATASEFLARAAREIGYSRWADPEQGTKYGRAYAQATGSAGFAASGVPFCSMGLDYVAFQVGMAGMLGTGRHYAYVPYVVADARALGRSVGRAGFQPGDFLCFDWDGDGIADHIGVGEQLTASGVQTIEFNTGDGVVARRVRSWSDVQAVVRPAYSASSGAAGATVTSAARAYRDITAIQRAVHTDVDNVCGPNTRKHVDAVRKASRWGGLQFPYGVVFAQLCVGTTQDGIWGEGSKAAHDTTTAAIQRAVGATVDGIWGPQTETKTTSALAAAEQP